MHAVTPQLAAAFRDHGLSERAVLSCFGVRSLAHVPGRILIHPMSVPNTPASLLPRIFIAGQAVRLERLQKLLGNMVDTLVETQLANIVNGRVRANVAVFPVGDSLAMSDRADCTSGRNVAQFPDDSAYHMLHCLPTKRQARWLDIGTGCALLPLARPQLSKQIIATDIHRRALDFARAGLKMSTARHIQLVQTNLSSGLEGSWQLITFNAPVPQEITNNWRSAPPYRASDEPGLLDRFWLEATRLVADDGEVLVHSWQPTDDYPECLGLPGRVVALRYTPLDSEHHFGVTRWWPSRRDEARLVRVDLDYKRPHVHRGLFYGE